MLLVLVGSALSVLFLESYNLYRQTPAEWESNRLHDRAMGVAHQVLQRYTAQKLGGLTREQLSYAGRTYTNQDLSDWNGFGYGSWDYWITDLEGNLMENGVCLSDEDISANYTFNLNCDYPVHATVEESAQIEQTQNWNYRDYYCTETGEHFLYYYTSPNYLVHMRFQETAPDYYEGVSRSALEFLYEFRYHMIALLAISLLLFIGCATYLCIAAGRTPSTPNPRLRGLCRLPLDLYLGICGAGAILLTAGAVVIAENTIYAVVSASPPAVALFILMLFAACVLVVGILCTAAAQFKMRDGYWWHHSVIGWCLHKIGFGIRFCFRGIRKLFRLLPLIWQWLVTAIAMVCVPFFCLVLAVSTSGFFAFVFSLWTIAACTADVAMVCYGAYAFGTLYKGVKAMAKGNLQEKIPTEHLFGAFRNFALELNTLADAATIAAKNQMRSERMKTELITNVSHDIKTPLTSLINYVDLLQSPHTEEDGQKYLEVLARQSQRMKKLIDDLMEMSKATTGNIQTDIHPLDAVEAVNQALGEFADKLISAQLTPLFCPPENAVMIAADGRLVWRVLSNLLSNVVKYSQIGRASCRERV